MPDILIRTDGSSEEGIGHIVRSSTIFDLFIRSGNRVRLLCDPAPEMRKLFFHLFAKIIPEPLEELPDLKTLKPDILITDLPPKRNRTPVSEYAVKHGIFHVGINDLLLANGSYDLCINPSIVPAHMNSEKTFSGTKYAVLNKRVTDALSPVSTVNKKVEMIFVSLGGTDPGGLTGLVLTALLHKISPEVQVFVVSGILSPGVITLKRKFTNLHVKENPENIGSILKSADIAIISGGITLYESCFSGVPAIVIPQNPYQEMTARAFEERSAAILFKPRERSIENSLLTVFEKLSEDFEARKQISESGRALIDGKGGQRVVSLILKSYSQCSNF